MSIDICVANNLVNFSIVILKTTINKHKVLHTKKNVLMNILVHIISVKNSNTRKLLFILYYGLQPLPVRQLNELKIINEMIRHLVLSYFLCE
jgi:hypothetical protein